MTELLGIPFSPWSEKARWALDVRRVPYRERVYAPLIGEPMLRWKVGRWAGPVTVPVLTADDGTVLTDSVDIARWADGRGEGPVLFPKSEEQKVLAFVALSEKGLGAGRVLSLTRMLADDEALREMVPKPVRRSLGPVATAMGALGIRRTLRKYAGSLRDRAASEATFVEVLDALRAALAQRGASQGPLLGDLTFADIAMAQVLVFMAPPPFGLRLGKASRRSFTDAALRERYQDLVSWRDALYEAHRPKVAERRARSS